MVKEKGFKQTEIGLVPEDWEVVRLGDYSKLKNGYGFSSEYFNEKGAIVITPGNFKLGGGLNFNSKNTLRYIGPFEKHMKFLSGDLLIVMTDLTPDCNLLGKSGIVSSDEIILHNQRIGKIETNEKIYKKYLSFYFNSTEFSNRMKSTATGSTVRHTSTPTIKNTIFPLPPLAEQEAIAEALSDCDAWIESLEQLIAKKRLLKQGAMQRLLEPGEGWEVKRLGEVGEIITGGTPSTVISTYWNGDIPWITPTDIGINKNIYFGERGISKEGINQIRKLPSNTLLVTCIASIGKNAILRIAGACNQQINAVVPFECFSVDFLYYLLELKKEVLRSRAGVTATPILSKAEFSLIQFLFPSLVEQTRIATILSDMDAELEALENKLGKARQVKQGMMQELLTGRVRLV